MGEQKDLWQRNVANLGHIFTGDYFTGRNLHTNFISDQNFFISIVTLLESNEKSLCSRLQVICLCAKFSKKFNSNWSTIGEIPLNGSPEGLVNTLISKLQPDLTQKK